MYIKISDLKQVFWEGEGAKLLINAPDGPACILPGHVKTAYPLVNGNVYVDGVLICHASHGVAYVERDSVEVLIL